MMGFTGALKVYLALEAQHAAWLVKRVLEYDRWRDWQVLLETYGRGRTGEIAANLRCLDPRAASFVRAYFSTSIPS